MGYETRTRARTAAWGEGSAESFIVSKNLHRRHLDASQRAMVAAKLAKRAQGDQSNASNGALSQDEAAQALNVGRSTVQRARQVIDKAGPETVRRPGQGNIADSAIIPVDDAQNLTGIRTYQVSRWRKRLRDKNKYRESMLASAYRKAHGRTNIQATCLKVLRGRRSRSPGGACRVPPCASGPTRQN